MNLKKYLTSSFFLKVIFTLSLFILIFISSISYKHSLTLAESSGWVIHSYKANVELEQMLSYLKDAEAGQRGFIITNDSVFLLPYNNARERVNGSFDELKKLTADNLQQQNNLDTLYQFINYRFELLENSLKINNQISSNKKLLNVNMLKGQYEMNKIRSQINKMIDLEMVYLKERQQKYEREIFFSPLFTLMILLFALMIFVFSFLKINKDLIVLKNSNAALLITNESIAHSEEIGTFSTWQWDLETNKLTYSDNQYRLLGCEPQSFEPTIEKFLEFVHPKDKHIIKDGANQVKKDNKYPAAFFRIIRKDGEVRYFKSLSKLVTDDYGRKTLIGVNSDITEQQLSSLALEERNRELEQSNKELASFNHVASHDLQEPLRVVQTYISRLNEKETAAMTDKGKEYFAKIKISVTRMRVLIDALLLFSRANKIEKVFEKTDLNLLLEYSKQDLAQAIEEKNTTIQSVQLPTLNVIPFQMQQLFTNLIGNSIKYSKPNVAPLIKIECEKISAKDQPELKTESKKKYFKISVTDNGLGFEQQYAEDIFSLFHRLHHDGEYEGTGIGLSICKKITENHSGYIFAKGEPNAGSAFFVLLPA